MPGAASAEALSKEYQVKSCSLQSANASTPLLSVAHPPAHLHTFCSHLQIFALTTVRTRSLARSRGQSFRSSISLKKVAVEHASGDIKTWVSACVPRAGAHY